MRLRAGPGGDRPVQPRVHRPGRAGLLAGEAEIADEPRPRRIRQVEDLGHPVRPPARHARDQVGDARIAFPPVLVRAGKMRGDRHDERRSGRVRHVPDLVCRVAAGAEQVDLALVGPWKLRAVAHAHHLRPGAGLARDMRQELRGARVGDLDDGSAVVLLASGQRIGRAPGVVPDVGDPPLALLLDDRLVGAASVQAVGADELHVAAIVRTGAQAKRYRE